MLFKLRRKEVIKKIKNKPAWEIKEELVIDKIKMDTPIRQIKNGIFKIDGKIL